MSTKIQKLRQRETELQSQFERADAEHTENAERTRQSANNRWELTKQLRSVRERIEKLEAAPADDDADDVDTQLMQSSTAGE